MTDPMFVIVESSALGPYVHHRAYEDPAEALRKAGLWQAGAEESGVPVEHEVYELRRVEG